MSRVHPITRETIQAQQRQVDREKQYLVQLNIFPHLTFENFDQEHVAKRNFLMRQIHHIEIGPLAKRIIAITIVALLTLTIFGFFFVVDAVIEHAKCSRYEKELRALKDQQEELRRQLEFLERTPPRTLESVQAERTGSPVFTQEDRAIYEQLMELVYLGESDVTLPRLVPPRERWDLSVHTVKRMKNWFLGLKRKQFYGTDYIEKNAMTVLFEHVDGIPNGLFIGLKILSNDESSDGLPPDGVEGYELHIIGPPSEEKRQSFADYLVWRYDMGFVRTLDKDGFDRNQLTRLLANINAQEIGSPERISLDAIQKFKDIIQSKDGITIPIGEHLSTRYRLYEPDEVVIEEYSIRPERGQVVSETNPPGDDEDEVFQVITVSYVSQQRRA